MTAPSDLAESLEAIGPLLARLEHAADPSCRAQAQGIVRAVLDYHGAALRRVLETARTQAQGEAFVLALAADDLVGSVLALHGLHPIPLEARARAALDRPCPNGWRVDRVDARAGGVRVAFERTTDARRAADPERVQSWAHEVLERAVPDAEAIELVGDFEARDGSNLVPVDRLLGRFAAEAPAGAPRCDGCAAPLDVVHAHRLEVGRRSLQCVCSACATAQGRWRFVPRRVSPIAELGDEAGAWFDQHLPVGLAFFRVSGEDRSVTATFPSAAGPTVAAIDPPHWSSLCASLAPVAALDEEVEALLVHRMNGARDHFIVSIDICYHLVGTVRAQRPSLGVGAGPEIAGFFESLRREAGRA